MKNKMLAAILCAATGIMACLSVPAGAQEGDRNERADSYHLEEVVVTATRSEKAADAVLADVDILNKKDVQTAPSAKIFQPMYGPVQSIEASGDNGSAAAFGSAAQAAAMPNGSGTGSGTKGGAYHGVTSPGGLADILRIRTACRRETV